MTNTIARRSASLVPVGDDLVRRGQALSQRRVRHGIRAVSELARLTGMDRKTIARAEAGEAAATSVQVLEQWFDQRDAEEGIDSRVPEESSGDLEPGVVKFRIKGPHTAWELETEAHIEDIDRVTRAVEKILRNVDNPPPDPGP